MLIYIARRLAWTVLVILVVLFVTFLVFFKLPDGDPGAPLLRQVADTGVASSCRSASD